MGVRRAPGALSAALASAPATHGLHADGRWRSWRDLATEAGEISAGLAPGCYLIDPARPQEAVTALLAVGLTPDASAILAAPGTVAAEPVGPALARLPGWTSPRPMYGTTTSGSTGHPKIALGWFDTLPAAPAVYAAALPAFAEAEFFATCSPIDFAGAFYACLIPALVRGRDLLLFPAHDWNGLAAAARERPGLCMATPAAMYAGALSLAAPVPPAALTLVPAAGYLSAARAERVQGALPGTRFLMLLGSTEMGLVSANPDPVGSPHVGRPIPGKPAWLEDVDASGVGTIWAAGVDVKHVYHGSAGPIARADGAVSSGDLAHLDEDGNFVLDGRADDTHKINGITVYPKTLERHILAIPGVQDVRVRIDRTGPLDRLTVIVVGDVAEETVRERCLDLPGELRPHTITRYADDPSVYSARGKL